jgi:hypothetical protein
MGRATRYTAGSLEPIPDKDIAQPNGKLPTRLSKARDNDQAFCTGANLWRKENFGRGKILTEGIFPIDAVDVLTNSS